MLAVHWLVAALLASSAGGQDVDSQEEAADDGCMPDCMDHLPNWLKRSAEWDNYRLRRSSTHLQPFRLKRSGGRPTGTTQLEPFRLKKFEPTYTGPSLDPFRLKRRQLDKWTLPPYVGICDKLMGKNFFYFYFSHERYGNPTNPYEACARSLGAAYDQASRHVHKRNPEEEEVVFRADPEDQNEYGFVRKVMNNKSLRMG